MKRRLLPAALLAGAVAAGALGGTLAGAPRSADGARSARSVVVRVPAGGRISASLLPTVARARRADGLSAAATAKLTASCAAEQVDLGTWCLELALHPVPATDLGTNDYFYATRACVAAGGYLPTAAQLVGAAAKVRLASTLDDSQLDAIVDTDATDGLKDRREMSATLVTTQAGSSAAGSEGVSDVARGNPNAGEPDPIPAPANPSPETLQYVTVYDNRDHGGFAGSKPVGQAENFRCAFDKTQSSSRPGAGG